MNHLTSASFYRFQIPIRASRQVSALLRVGVVSMVLLQGFTEVTAATTYTWVATANGNWNTNANWLGGAAPASGADDIIDVSTVNLTANRTLNLNNGTTGLDRTAGTLIFGDLDTVTSTGNWTVNPNGTGRLILDVTSGTGTIQLKDGTTTINALVAGSDGLTKTGAGKLVLANAGNTLTGGIFLNAGSLSFVQGGLGNNLITFTGNSTLQWDTNVTQDVSTTNGILLNDGVTATIDSNGNSFTLATAFQLGALSNAAVTKAGGGGVTFTAANTYTGGTRINNGRLVLAGGDNRLAATGALSLGNAANSGVLQLGNAAGASNQTITGLTITSGANGLSNAIVGGSATNSTLTINNASTISTGVKFMFGGTGTNENNLNLTKMGAGSLTLAKLNTFTGNVNIEGGAVILTVNGALGAGAKTVTISGTTDAPSLQLNSATGIALDSSISFVTSNDTGTGAIVNTAGDNIISGDIALADGGFGGTQTRIKVNGGSLTLEGSITASASAVSERTLILDGDANGTATGVIKDNGAIKMAVTKEGIGIWTLDAANSYSGATTVTAGQLNLTTAQTGGGAITLSDDTTLGIKLAGAGQTLNTSAFTLGVGATLSFNLGAFSNPSAAMINATAFTTNGSNAINVAGTGLGLGIFDLITYTGSIEGADFAGLTLNSLPARVSAILVDNTLAHKVQLDITAFDVPKWTGATDDIWDINDGADPTTGIGTVNWKEANSGLDTRYLQSGNAVDSVLFDDSAKEGLPGLNKNVILSTNLTPITVTVNNTITGGDYTFSGDGKLSGSTALTKLGNGTLIFANTGGNDNTGTTTISNGILQAGDGAVAGAGQLGTGSIDIGINGTLALNRPVDDDYTLSNTISGSGALIQQGGNTVTLSGNNANYDGEITVSTGALRVGSANALGSALGGVTVESGGVLALTGQIVADAIQLNGGTLSAFSLTTNNVTSGIVLNGGGTLDGLNSTILTVSSAITGDGGLNKTGNGTAILTFNNNTYTGTTTITQGVLQLGVAGVSTMGLVGAGDIDFAADAGNTATLTILRSDSTLNISNKITSTGAGAGLIIIGVNGAASLSGTVTLSGDNTDFTGNVTINGGALKITNSNALGSGPKVVNIGSNAGPSLQLDGTLGNLTLAAGINFTISSDGGVANAASNAGAIVNLAGDNTINGNISVINGGGGQGRIQALGGSLTINGNIDSAGATGARTLQLGGSATGTINGVIADASFVTSLTKDGTGIWTLTGNNTFTGAVTVNAGTLKFGAAQALGSATGTINLGNATTAGTLEYAGSEIATLDRAITVGGVAGGIVKNSGAVLTLNGTLTNTNGRPLTLTGGEFIVSGQIVGALTSNLIVDNAIVTFTTVGKTYTGPTFVKGGGTLKNGVTNAMSPGTTLTLGDATNNSNGTYDLNGFDASVAGLAGAGTGVKLVTNSGASGTNTLTVTGTSSFDGLIKDGANAQTALTKGGTGILTLTGANTFTGSVTVNGGTLSVGQIAANTDAQSLGKGSVINLGNATTAGTLEYTGSTVATLDRAITVGGLGGGIIKNSGGALLTLSNTLTKDGSPLTLTGGQFVVSGQIVGASANSDLIVDNATVTLTHAANSYNGPTFVTGGGTLKNGVTNALPAGTTLTLGEATNNSNGTYDLNGFNSSVTGLSGAGTGVKLVTNNGAIGINTLTVTGASSFGGLIQDGATAKIALTKSGTGEFTLTGINSYTGPTTVSGGSLVISTSGVISSNVTVNTGAELSVSGTINGNVSLDTGGSFQVSGASNTGLSTINGGLSFNSGSDLFFDIGGIARGAAIGGYDAIDGLTSLTLSGTIHIRFINDFIPVGDEAFNLFDWTQLTQFTNNGFVLDFSQADPGAGLSWSTTNFNSTGNIVISAAPEPSRALLLFAGLAAAFLRRRRTSAPSI